MEKYTRQEVSPVERENERDENYEAANPQIDSSRTSRNYHLAVPPPEVIAKKQIHFRLYRGRMHELTFYSPKHSPIGAKIIRAPAKRRSIFVGRGAKKRKK